MVRAMAHLLLDQLASFAGLGLVLAACAARDPDARSPKSSSGRAAGDRAELALVNGTILTMDPARPVARAVAMQHGRIVYVGDDATPWIGPGTRVIELAGRTAVPSLTDAHAHLTGLGDKLEQVDLVGCASAEECARRTSQATPGGPDEWIRGRGWDQNKFPDKAFPTHAALDKASGGRPVWFRRVDGHAGWANARAMELAKIDKTTPDPPGGKILRDASGEPTGVLVDNAMRLVSRIMPELSDEARARSILRAQEIALEQGLTEVHEMGIDSQTVRVYRQLAAEGKLKIRIYAYRSSGDFTEALASKPDGITPYAFFTVRGIKLFADGALGSRGAALLTPYSDDKDNVGLMVTPPDRLERATARAFKAGWQIAVHAIGDRANRVVLDAFEKAGCTSARDHRFRVEHAQILAPEDIARFRSLGVIASMQPKHATSDMPWAEARLGKDRLAGAYAWRRILDSGAKVAWGSDFPVEGVSVLQGLHAAMTRTDESGEPEGGWFPEQRLTPEEALAGFTTGAAYAAFEESWRGRAAVDQAADFTVFDADVRDASKLQKARAVFTIVGGKVQYERK
jgi:predicted amidohydrolase YtcJ